MSQLQISLAAMFGITAAVAATIALFNNVGSYWLLVIAITIAALKAPTWPEVNPILVAVGYMLLVLTVNSVLSYCMDVTPMHAVISCFLLPAMIYIVSFVKGMENA